MLLELLFIAGPSLASLLVGIGVGRRIKGGCDHSWTLIEPEGSPRRVDCASFPNFDKKGRLREEARVMNDCLCPKCGATELNRVALERARAELAFHTDEVKKIAALSGES